MIAFHPGSRWRTLRRRLAWLVALLSVPAIAYLVGLTWFAESIPRTIERADEETDAVVALTGGPLRLRAALAILAEGRAKKLFVSGVYRGVDVAELLRVARQRPDSVECCIVLGYAADNTAGNAMETHEWMARQGYTSLRLVTASYHMQRSLLEFHRAMPAARIVPHPVFPDGFMRDAWWRWPGTLSLIVTEYHKYLAALARPLWNTAHEPAAS